MPVELGSFIADHKTIAPLGLVARGLLVLAGFTGMFYSLAGAFVAGTSWDAPYDTGASQVTRNLASGLTLSQAYEQVPQISEYYGVLVFQLVDAVRWLSGETGTLNSSNPDTYVWQGITNTVVATLAIGVFAWAIGRSTRSSLIGTATWGTVMTLPIWVGMSHMNFKDMTVASGLSLFSAGLLFAYTGRPVSNRRPLLLATIPLTLGSFLAIGTRVGAIILVLALGGIVTLWWLAVGIRAKRVARPLEIGVASAISVLLSLVLLWWTNPIARINTAGLLIDSIRVSGSFPIDFAVRVAGQDVSTTNLPLWYAPAWAAAQLPLALWLWIGVCLVAFVALLRSRKLSRSIPTLNSLTPVIAQALVLPVLIIASGATLYDGIRHLMFAVPPLIALLVVALCKSVSASISQPRAQLILPVLVLAGVGLNLFAVARWFPYTYAYINPIAGIGAPERNWELDYWGVSAREGVEKLKALGADEVVVLPNADMAVPYGGRGMTEVISDGDAVLGIYAFQRFEAELPENSSCSQVFEIRRDRQVLGLGGLCGQHSQNPSEYPESQ